MQIQTALDNFFLLKNIKPHERLTVDPDTLLLSLDQRWLKSLQRSYSGNSRADLIVPIQKTFEILMKNKMFHQQKIYECLDHISEVFSETYPNYENFNALIKELKRKSGTILENIKTRVLDTPSPTPHNTPSITKKTKKEKIVIDEDALNKTIVNTFGTSGPLVKDENQKIAEDFKSDPNIVEKTVEQFDQLQVEDEPAKPGCGPKCSEFFYNLKSKIRNGWTRFKNRFN